MFYSKFRELTKPSCSFEYTNVILYPGEIPIYQALLAFLLTREHMRLVLSTTLAYI